jgi:hypothetical protein
MTYRVILRTDPARACVDIMREDEPLSGGDGVRYRLVLETADAAEAEQAAAPLRELLARGWTGR